jgi:predicted Fe-Mo cluster-binding NifX family protein
MEKIVAAFASDEGELLIDRHFGDSKRYSIYRISSSEAVFIRDVENSTAMEEKAHADPGKAKGVAGLLEKNGVQAVVSKVFGPNIEKIKRYFVCVMVSAKTVNDGITALQENLDAIVTQWEKGEERDPVDMRE